MEDWQAEEFLNIAMIMVSFNYKLFNCNIYIIDFFGEKIYLNHQNKKRWRKKDRTGFWNDRPQDHKKPTSAECDNEVLFYKKII